jgi:EAL domain-containing protein (putative c-di-GMP-specific phosphodiesterase class I)/ActR/RegA family two-component response regulator
MSSEKQRIAHQQPKAGFMHGFCGAVLIVDDDEFQCDFLSLQLAGLGVHEVFVAASGTEALQQFDQHQQRIQLIISDLSMPDMDGLVLMRHLASRHFSGGVILLSGLNSEILNSATGLAQAHHLQVLGSLNKPCGPNQLRELLGRLSPAPDPVRQAGLSLTLSRERLQAALDADQFVAWYQPQIELSSGQAVAVEALARWPQADGSLVGPALFVPAMEAVGLADGLFFAMARQVTQALADWRRMGLNVRAAINMSMETALNLAIPERLHAIVCGAGLCPGDLVVEVTESCLMVERSLALESLTRLSMMGYTLSIDDFGTGYSSLIQLIDLPFKELKIDGSFVQRAASEPKARSILRIASLLSHELGMNSVAEGVETVDQLDFIRACGGQLVQGYLFSRPLPLAEVTRWLQARNP